ncbi:MAG: head GIN domain-containing protein [Hyphomonadaceae bacterium]
MTRPTSPIILAGAALAAVSMCGAAFAETRSFPATGFKSVSASSGVDVVLKQGPFSISAEGDSKALDRLRVERKGDTLSVWRKSSNWFQMSGGKVTVTVTAPALSKISASSGADIEGDGFRFDALDISVSSGADIELSGTCTDLDVGVSSGSDFDGERLTCRSVSVDVSSGGDASVFASASVKAEASSGGDVTVYGNPAEVSRDTSSGGHISIK